MSQVIAKPGLDICSYLGPGKKELVMRARIVSAILGLGAMLVPTPLPHRGQPQSLLELPERLAVSENKGCTTGFGHSSTLRFEANHGQIDERVRFLSRATNSSILLTASGAELSFLKLVQRESFCGYGSKPGKLSVPRRVKFKAKNEVLRLTLAGSNPSPRIEGMELLKEITGYFVGRKKEKWLKSVPNYGKVKYRNIYPGIDLLYYGRDENLEYDFIVDPGADANRINLFFDGAKRVSTAENGDLIISLDTRELRQRQPVVYQETGRARRHIACHYILKGHNRVGFKVGDYDKSRPLIIDPVLAFSTYFGGSTGSDSVQSVAVSSSGNVFITGIALSPDFPTTRSARFGSEQGRDDDTTINTDAFISKFAPDGTLVYSVLLGGSASDSGGAIAVDSSENVYVTGSTGSFDFPTTSNAIQPDLNFRGADDVFVAKVREGPEGVTLTYSTYLGGDKDDGGRGIASDEQGNVYVTGFATRGFPVKNAFQKRAKGEPAAFAAKINTVVGDLIFATFLGGGGTLGTFGNAIALEGDGSAWITGETDANGYPTTSKALLKSASGKNDAFVTKINPSGSSLDYSSYLGGSKDDSASAIAVDPFGNAYLAGATNSDDFLDPFNLNFGETDAFVIKVNINALLPVTSVMMGGSGSDFCTGIGLDRNLDIYVTGITNSPDFAPLPENSLNMGTAPSCSGGRPCADAFVVRFSLTAGFFYSRYIGGSDRDFGLGIAVDSSGAAYVCGITASGDFPVNPCSVQSTHPGGASNAVGFLAKVSGPFEPDVQIELEQTVSDTHPSAGSNIVYTLTATNFGSDNSTCILIANDLPPGVEVLNCSTQPHVACSHEGNVLSAGFASIPAGKSAVLSVEVNIPCTLSNGAVLTNIARFSSFGLATPIGDSVTSIVTVSRDPLVATCPDNIVTVTRQPRDQRVSVEFEFIGSGGCAGLQRGGCVPSGGSLFPVGTTVVTCFLADALGSAGCSFSVNVFDVCIADDKTGDFLLFKSTGNEIGNYLFTKKDSNSSTTRGFTIFGTGSVSFTPLGGGCLLISLSDTGSATRTVSASVNTCDRTGSAMIEISGKSFSVTDTGANKNRCQDR